MKMLKVSDETFLKIKDQIEAEEPEVMSEYKVIRTYSAGVFYAKVESRKGREAVLLDSKRIHYWDGAASLSQLAMQGVSKPENCRIPCAMKRHEVTEVIEVIDMTVKAKLSLDGVAVWKK